MRQEYLEGTIKCANIIGKLYKRLGIVLRIQNGKSCMDTLAMVKMKFNMADTTVATFSTL